MRYIDSGTRDPQETLGAWLENAVAGDVTHLRFQTGFFGLDGLSPLVACIDDLSRRQRSITALIGANDGATLLADVAELAHRMEIPRSTARLGVVSFGEGYFHPKVYHVELSDGAQFAYVGSANLTPNGLGKHVEAGVLLCSHDDGQQELTKIAEAIDRWFTDIPNGLNVVADLQDLERLREEGILSLSAPARPAPSGQMTGNIAVSKPKLKRLFPVTTVPRLVPVASTGTPPPSGGLQSGGGHLQGTKGGTAATPAAVPSPSPASAPSIATAPAPTRPIVNKKGFPDYMFFSPSATAATVGYSALTGAQLPNGAAGLIVVLNKDSGRHFLGNPGTSNQTLPTQTMSTLRFGVDGKHQSPTAHFDLQMRYLGGNVDIRAAVKRTSVKGYGFTSGEKGHGDIRLVVTAQAKELAKDIKAAQLAVPGIGDYALLEWPTDIDPSFKLTFLEKSSGIYQVADVEFKRAKQQGALVGGDACWLKIGLSPIW